MGKQVTPEQLAKQLRGFSDRLNRWQQIAPRMHGYLLAREKDRWKTQGASEGDRWPKQQPKWARLKTKLGIEPVPLRWLPGKERLFPSLTKKNHREHLWRKTFDGVHFGTKVPYAWRHALGKGKNPLGEQIPQRRFAHLSDRSQERLTQLLAVYIARGNSRGNRWDK